MKVTVLGGGDLGEELDVESRVWNGKMGRALVFGQEGECECEYESKEGDAAGEVE